jgi:hypothetical protein
VQQILFFAFQTIDADVTVTAIIRQVAFSVVSHQVLTEFDVLIVS